MYLDQFPITSTFRDHLLTGRPSGTDFKTPSRTKISLYESGELSIHTDDYGGIYAWVQGTTYNWLYLHLSKESLKIKSGYYEAHIPLLITGNTGWSTGAHTHLEVRTKGGQHLDPMDVIPEFRKQDLIFNIFTVEQADKIISQNEKIISLLEKDNIEIFEFTHSGRKGIIFPDIENGSTGSRSVRISYLQDGEQADNLVIGGSKVDKVYKVFEQEGYLYVVYSGEDNKETYIISSKDGKEWTKPSPLNR